MKKIIVITDFDGTITKRDTLVEILDRFAGPKWRKIAKLVHGGKMGTRIALKKEFALCRVTKKEYITFLSKNVKIDATFKSFLGFCKENKLGLLIVSGGFGLNIETVFRKHGINKIPYYANKISFNKDRIKIFYPYKDKTCSDCGHCKAPYIRKFKKRGYFTIYIGDSVTDRCPAKVADLVFAKHHLAEYCEEKEINYIPYNKFSGIQRFLKSASISFFS